MERERRESVLMTLPLPPVGVVDRSRLSDMEGRDVCKLGRGMPLGLVPEDVGLAACARSWADGTKRELVDGCLDCEECEWVCEDAGVRW